MVGPAFRTISAKIPPGKYHQFKKQGFHKLKFFEPTYFYIRFVMSMCIQKKNAKEEKTQMHLDDSREG